MQLWTACRPRAVFFEHDHNYVPAQQIWQHTHLRKTPGWECVGRDRDIRQKYDVFTGDQHSAHTQMKHIINIFSRWIFSLRRKYEKSWILRPSEANLIKLYHSNQTKTKSWTNACSKLGKKKRYANDQWLRQAKFSDRFNILQLQASIGLQTEFDVGPFDKELESVLKKWIIKCKHSKNAGKR